MSCSKKGKKTSKKASGEKVSSVKGVKIYKSELDIIRKIEKELNYPGFKSVVFKLENDLDYEEIKSKDGDFINPDDFEEFYGEEDLNPLYFGVYKKRVQSCQIRNDEGEVDWIEVNESILEDIYKLKDLRYLSIREINVDSLGKGISNLEYLLYLRLDTFRNLTEFPKEICNLCSLKELVLEQTEIEEIPKCITDNWQSEEVDDGDYRFIRK